MKNLLLLLTITTAGPFPLFSEMEELLGIELSISIRKTAQIAPEVHPVVFSIEEGINAECR